MAKKKYAVLGLGTFGRSLAISLAEQGAEVLAIDNDPIEIDQIKDIVSVAAQADSTDRVALEQMGLADMDVAVVCMSTNLEANVLATAHLLDLGVKRVLSRARNKTAQNILERLGAHEAFLVEGSYGAILADRLIRPEIVAEMDLGEGYLMIQWRVTEKIAGKQLRELELPTKFHVHVVGVRRSPEFLLALPSASDPLQCQDKIVLMGRKPDLERFCEAWKDKD